MIVWLVDFDGKIENLALMKLSTYWKRQGATVRLKYGAAYPELWGLPDKVFISCIFRWNQGAALRLAYAWGDRAEIGGTGVDITKTLPPEVEACEPDYGLYGESQAIGFISRGCIRSCPWCVVPNKEGRLHRVDTAENIVGDRINALFLDNNFLALDDHDEDLHFLVRSHVGVDFNQGLDARLVNEVNAPLLAACNWTSGPRFALDSDSRGQRAALERTLNLLEQNGLSRNQVLVYTLIGFGGLQSDIERLTFIRELGARPFPMGYRDLETGDEPANGWNKTLYKKYRRLICRIPFSKSVWSDFGEEVGLGKINTAI
jgi:hypothetical protein